MNELPDRYIQDRYDDILKQLEGGKLFGYPINMYDVRHIVVAANLIGMVKEQEKFSNHLKFESDMRWFKGL